MLLALELKETGSVLLCLNVVEAGLNTTLQQPDSTLEVAQETGGLVTLHLSVLNWESS